MSSTLCYFSPLQFSPAIHWNGVEYCNSLCQQKNKNTFIIIYGRLTAVQAHWFEVSGHNPDCEQKQLLKQSVKKRLELPLPKGGP